MLDRTGTYLDLAKSLPDIPRWLETRSMLLSGEGEVLGLDEGDEATFVVRDPVTFLVSVVGRAPPEALREAVFRNRGLGVVLSQLDDEAYVRELLPDWRPSPAVLHFLADESRLPEVPPEAVRFVTITEVAAIPDMPQPLRDELKAATLRSEVAATIVDGEPVSFCYGASVTESLWDVSVDTLEPHRGRGYASLCVARMVEHMFERRRRPVWGAEESNEPSMRLASKLGFVPVDRLLVLHPPGE